MLTKVRSSRLEVRGWKLGVGIGKTIFWFLFSIFFSLSANAQCAMCRAALETEGNTAKVQAVNDGIVYLMVIPYLLIAAIGYYIYRMWKKKK